MIEEKDGVYRKFVCPSCGGDNVGESGLGKKFLHCFGHCMADMSREDFTTEVVTNQREIKILQQDPY